MNNAVWIEHLSHWKNFLERRADSAGDTGEKEKILRQIMAIERVRYSAVLNPRLLIEFITPSAKGGASVESNPEFCLCLNKSQQEAVLRALNPERSLVLIQGPPGTGKTTVITEICLQLYRQNPNVRILVCSETHVAVNNIIARISKFDAPIRVMRIRDKEQDADIEAYSPETVVNDYENWLSEVCTDPDIIKVIRETMPEPDNKGLEKALALSANIVGMTCNRVGAYRFLDSTEMFDYAIIDEVCKATLPEILMPLTVSKKAVLVGDPKQLPPVFCSEDIEVLKAIEDCDLQRFMYIDELFKRAENTVLLDTQYRMEQNIGSMISRMFYDGDIKNGRADAIERSLVWLDYKPTRKWPEPDKTDGGRPIIRNLDEAKIITKLLAILDEQADKEKSIAVIAPYRYQIAEIRKRLSNYNKLKVNVDTVDGFQGKECDCVIFGITRTTGSYRFLADPRRLNVALSRAKDKIIIVGNAEYAEKQPLMKKVKESCHVIVTQL